MDEIGLSLETFRSSIISTINALPLCREFGKIVYEASISDPAVYQCLTNWTDYRAVLPSGEYGLAAG